MSLTKQECENVLSGTKIYLKNQMLKKERISHSVYLLNTITSLLEKLIQEHFENPPLYMDEIPKGIWIWDNVNKECIRSLGCVELDGIIYVKFERSENSSITNYLEYEPNRFYRKEVRNVK